MYKNSEINSNYSIVGKKILLGFSGLVLLSFVIVHLLGNLSVFAGQDAINTYAHFLHKNAKILNIGRAFFLVNSIMHVYLSISITLTNRSARQVQYISKNNIRTTFAASTMIISGIVILCFVIFHLSHFTFGLVSPESYGLLDSKQRFDVYTMIVADFSNIYISLIYFFALGCLGLHLSHAFFSVCQTFSIISTKEAINKFIVTSQVLSILITLGYVSIPFSIVFKIIS